MCVGGQSRPFSLMHKACSALRGGRRFMRSRSFRAEAYASNSDSVNSDPDVLLKDILANALALEIVCLAADQLWLRGVFKVIDGSFELLDLRRHAATSTECLASSSGDAIDRTLASRTVSSDRLA